MCTSRIIGCLREGRNHAYVDDERQSLLSTDSNSCKEAGDIACAIGTGVVVGVAGVGFVYGLSAVATSGCIDVTAPPSNQLCPSAETCTQVFNPCLADNIERSIGFNLLWGLFSFAACCGGYKSAQRMYEYRKNGCEENLDTPPRPLSPGGFEN